MKLPPPPLSGPALRALVSAAESKGLRGLVYKVMTKQMGITALLAVSTGDEPMPVDHRPVPYAGRAAAGELGDLGDRGDMGESSESSESREGGPR